MRPQLSAAGYNCQFEVCNISKANRIDVPTLVSFISKAPRTFDNSKIGKKLLCSSLLLAPVHKTSHRFICSDSAKWHSAWIYTLSYSPPPHCCLQICHNICDMSLFVAASHSACASSTPYLDMRACSFVGVGFASICNCVLDVDCRTFDMCLIKVASKNGHKQTCQKILVIRAVASLHYRTMLHWCQHVFRHCDVRYHYTT